MRRWKWTKSLVALTLGFGGMFAVWTMAEGQELRGIGRAQRGEQSMSKLAGRVKELTKSPRGAVDGFILENDSQIHFPPHLGDRVAKAVTEGDRVEITGRFVALPNGEQVFEATQIVGRGGTINIDNEPPRPGRLPPAGPRGRRMGDEPMTKAGTFREFVTNPHGDVDGLLLSDGTEVKVPPHQGSELMSVVKEGDEIRIEGRRHETPHGEIHLHADRIIGSSAGKVFEREEPAGRAAENAEILKELREIRRLLESQQAK
jgi:hypothetical protein